jgi:hypothetical protein
LLREWNHEGFIFAGIAEENAIGHSEEDTQKVRTNPTESNLEQPYGDKKGWMSEIEVPGQPGLAWFCFLFPLIEPDWQISRIRLGKGSRFRPRKVRGPVW